MQRNLKTSEQNLKNTAYLTCIRPILDYACAVWDPSQVTLSDELEKIQNRAARFVLGRYKRGDSCTQMKNELGWELLSSRRRKLRLKFFFQIFHNKTGINKENYFKEPHYRSHRTDHVFKIREWRTRTDLLAKSFFVKTIKEWNRLSEAQVCCKNEDLFMSML